MNSPSSMLATDMDGTISPLEVNPERKDEIRRFREVVDTKPDFTLAYVTGRDLPLALKGIREHRLPVPRILVCDVGTSVYYSTPSGFAKDGEYVKLMEDARGGVDVRDLRHELTGIPNLFLQPEERQTESKLSYHLPPEVDHDEIVLEVPEAEAADAKLVLQAIMEEPPRWADGLPLTAEPTIMTRYGK